MNHALLLHGARDARVAPFSLRDSRGDEVLIKVAAVGVCGSDLHYFKDGGIGSLAIRQPFVPGHEFGGWLEADDMADGLKRGTLVAVDPSHVCGVCDHCRAGHPNLCPNVEFIGAPPHDGAMTNEIWVPRQLLVPLPETFGADHAAMLEPLGVAIHAVGLAKPRLLERVAVLGCGPIGLLIVQVLKAAGAGEILAIEPLSRRRELASQFGAARVGATIDELHQWTSGKGCPLVVEATNSPDGFRDAVSAARIGGRIVLVGIPDGNTYTLPAADARRRGLSIKFARRMGQIYPQAIELVATGKVDVLSLISDRIGLDTAPEALRNLADGAPGMVKVMVYPNGLEQRATA